MRPLTFNDFQSRLIIEHLGKLKQDGLRLTLVENQKCFRLISHGKELRPSVFRYVLDKVMIRIIWETAPVWMRKLSNYNLNLILK